MAVRKLKKAEKLPDELVSQLSRQGKRDHQKTGVHSLRRRVTRIVSDDPRLVKLRGWRDFDPLLATLDDEAEVLEYLELEKETFAREYVMNRLHGRYCLLRARREKQELRELAKSREG